MQTVALGRTPFPYKDMYRTFRLSLALSILVAPLVAAQSASDFGALRARTIGPANMSGRIVDLAVNEANSFEFYAASATGGVWKTSDNGVTWAPVFENEASHSVGSITLDQRYPSVLWVGTGEATNRQSSGWGDGVYKSTKRKRTRCGLSRKP